jgi:hypothetical protein
MPQATEQAQNGRDEQLATLDSPLRRTQSRGCSIALFWAGSNRQSACHPATARFYRHSGDAGHRHLLATPAVNHRGTSSRGIESSATAGTGAPQVAGRRINPLEAPRDLAAARAQTVWADPQQPSTIPRTRRRSHRLHVDPAHYSCRKRQSRLRTTELISGGLRTLRQRWI